MKKKFIAFFILPALIILYLLSCVFLYCFEPISYNAPDLTSDYSFSFYSKFSKEKNDEFYIKQITYDDVVSVDADLRHKYIDNTILVISDKNADYDIMNSLFQAYGGNICGYIAEIDFYQVEFTNKSYYELRNICSELSANKNVKSTLIDYFEETPVSDATTQLYNSIANDYYYLDMIDAYDAWSLSAYKTEDIMVGVFDVPVDYSNKNINVINNSDYPANILDNENIKNASSHGTHVAGIIAASYSSETPGICPNAKIYSENAINNSISYWLTSLANMIINENINIINISMGYNSYIPVSASLGCDNSIDYINTENAFFEAFLSSVLDNNYDYLLCLSAGNETGTSLYKTHSEIFTYGEKELLRKLDVFDIFSVSPEFCDAEYQLAFTAIEDEDVRNRIIIVGSCDYFKEYSDFASAGSAVDIVAPGESIYSTGHASEYMYMSGTSMAAPFVTGSAALLYSLDNTLSCPEIKQILLDTANETISAYGFDYPLLNVGNAVEYVLSK